LVGGYTPSVSPSTLTDIQKFSLTSDSNGTDVGDLTRSASPHSNQKSTVSGYTGAGYTGAAFVNTIDKFPFASDGNATDVGDATACFNNATSGHSSPSNGYIAGGQAIGNSPQWASKIDKFPTSSDANASTIGNLTTIAVSSAAQQSTTHGYVSGGDAPYAPTNPQNVIQKYPFSTEPASSTDVGDLTRTHVKVSGSSSPTHGYTHGGSPNGSTACNNIDKFPFASDTNASDVGDLTVVRFETAGQSSTTHGYASAGQPPPQGCNVIDKYPFSSDTNATDVGDFNRAVNTSGGTQV